MNSKQEGWAGVVSSSNMSLLTDQYAMNNEEYTFFYSNEKETVLKSGGFYVSRYEIGIDNKERAEAQSENGVESSLWDTLYSQYNKEPVRNITWDKAVTLANSWKLGDNYKSGLITGTQWDVICNFIGWDICDTPQPIWANLNPNESKNYAIEIWHSGEEIENRGIWLKEYYHKISNKSAIFPTGVFINSKGSRTSQKNIYDIAGNCAEWTTEVPGHSDDCRINRGGNAYDESTSLRATSRSGSSSFNVTATPFLGFRVVLYIK